MISRFLWACCALLAFASSAFAIPSGGVVIGVALPPGFYVSTIGSDSNDGTTPTTIGTHGPFLTIGKCQTAMDGSGSIKTCYIRGGVYTLSSPINFNSNEYYRDYPPDGLGTAQISTSGAGNQAFFASGVNNVALYGLAFTSAPSGFNIVFIQSSSTNIYVDENTFSASIPNSQDIIMYNSSNVYIRGNSFSGAVANDKNNMSFTYNDGLTHSGLYITDNTFTGCTIACIENGFASGNVTSNAHLDRNTFTNFQGTNNVCAQAAFAAISIVTQNSTNISGQATVIGNTFTVPQTTNNCIWSVEADWPNTTYQNNTSSAGVGIAFDLSSTVGGSTNSAFLGNTITTQSQSQQSGCGGNSCAFGGTGQGYIGSNTINGSSVTGCSATGSPSYCQFAPYTNPGQPTLYSASTPYTGTFP